MPTILQGKYGIPDPFNNVKQEIFKFLKGSKAELPLMFYAQSVNLPSTEVAGVDQIWSLLSTWRKRTPQSVNLLATEVTGVNQIQSLLPNGVKERPICQLSGH